MKELLPQLDDVEWPMLGSEPTAKEQKRVNRSHPAITILKREQQPQQEKQPKATVSPPAVPFAERMEKYNQLRSQYFPSANEKE